MHSAHIKRGFTLIELLVVVSIIALLSSLVMSALQDARAKARDRALFSGVLELQKAVELYKIKYGVYPEISPSTTNNTITRDYNGNYSGTSNYANTMLPQIREFLSDLPQPTISGGYVGFYNSTAWHCPDNLIAPYSPYVIVFTPENMSMFSNLSSGIYFVSTGATNFTTTLKCISLK